MFELDRYTLVEEWTEDHLSSIPDGETDYYEYKSSLISFERLKKEITVAASAFWNSGGGIFIAGVDDTGKVDGGIFAEVGNQKLRDWADQVLSHVEPTGPYAINAIEPNPTPSAIENGKAVLVIAFGESANAPHMAPDYRYYVRAGTHSLPAGHFLVEAIRSRRGLHHPFLRGLLRLSSSKTNIVELVVLAANDATALDVQIKFDPLPKVFRDMPDQFPLVVPIIDRENPFTMDLLSRHGIQETLGEVPVYLELTYSDVAGNSFRERQLLDPHRNLSPVPLGSEDVDEIKRSLKQIVKQMKRLNYMVDRTSNGQPRHTIRRDNSG